MNFLNEMSQELGWLNAQQALLRYELVNTFVKSGDVIIDIGAGYGLLGDYLLKVAGKNVTYVPVEPQPDFYKELSQKYPHAINKTLFQINSPHAVFGDILPADVIVASGVVAELSVDRTLKVPVDRKEHLFIKMLLNIPSKLYIFDIWDKFFFKRTGVGDARVRASDPGKILDYVEENLNTKDKVFYIRPIKDEEASFFIVQKVLEVKL